MIRNTSKTILLEARSDTTVNLPRKNYTKKPKGPLRGAFTHQLPDQVPSEEGNANQSTMELYLGIGHNRTTRKKGNPTSTKKRESSKLLCLAPFSYTKLGGVGHSRPSGTRAS